MWNRMTPGMAALVAAWDEHSTEEAFETGSIRNESLMCPLEGAQSSFAQGCHHDAAILAGHVLEDTMRKLCQRNEVPLPKKPTVETMNAELARKGIYDDVLQDRLQWMAELCEHARLGLWSEFSPSDVETMLQQMHDFVVQYPA
jgi:hypothetical protein